MASWATRAAKTLRIGAQVKPLAARTGTHTLARTFAAGGQHGEGVTHAGLTLHKPTGWHVYFAQGLSGLMWFWVFYRFRQDYDTFLFGHAQHFEHEDEHGEEH
mmetsp:Transcript_1541/g.3379  ORF Transcript_1541/g.3379 Transcript_1541/m.3379 type:complete len:103 (+) Transcript_1541:22-330(+)|eukprot:CAMPEP_0198234912 /NCGR_PEP_ID=MMETSP1446-20131203/790_1 /TAXON_ID=1461542 ORGANISM="Unidentified sp, Strain CCMP2111" /NCGR_SAMPLE_ID=MMETSP1446 /ASSEMBLY_ACC=CAM_ASM_001112 /LENGTH=102 /DNA_ID=CAMNT_0043915775 /DNA_START=22 /DNA_END=330 /DNA_ORIENTATION=-